MTAVERIKAAVANGLKRPAIEALLGRSLQDSEVIEYRRAKAVYDLQLRKRRTERKYEHLSGTERSHKSRDAASSIDRQIDEARQNINWERRRKAEKSLYSWIITYGIGVFIDDPPPAKGKEILKEMERALRDSRPYQLCIARGFGKSCYCCAAVMYALSTGLRKFCLFLASNAKNAQQMMNDAYRVVMVSEAYRQDYPDMALPHYIVGSSTRRKQTYRGVSTEISKNASQCVFARLLDEDGTPCPTSGAIMQASGILSGIRGRRVGTQRIDLCVIDDAQDDEIASNQESVEKLLSVIRKDVLNLGGKGKMACLMTATPIEPDDLVEKIASDINWKTTRFPAIIRFPRDIVEKKDDGLWGEYFRLYDEENADDQPHKKSLKFYRDHRSEMDNGAELLNPKRYKREDGYISGLQAMLVKRHEIGNAAFMSEYQMKPQRQQFALTIEPKTVKSRMNRYPRLTVPDGFVFTSCATDINPAYALTTTVVSYKPDTTSVVVAHIIQPVHIDQKLNATEYNQQVFDALAEHGRQLKSLGVAINGWGIDAGGSNFDAVCLFARESISVCGLPACALVGRSSTKFNGLVRSRLRNEINSTVLCGDEAEHIRSGTGKKYLFWNADLYKERVQRAFLAEVGAAGGCSLYQSDEQEHTEFAIQFCNERLKGKSRRQDGRDEYFWKTSDPHDYLDTMAMCLAIAGQQGLSPTNIRNLPTRRILRTKPRVRIV